MKKLLLSLGCLCVGILPMMAEVSASLQPESCTVGNRPFTSPLTEVAFYFDGGIQLFMTSQGEKSLQPNRVRFTSKTAVRSLRQTNNISNITNPNSVQDMTLFGFLFRYRQCNFERRTLNQIWDILVNEK